MLLLIQVCLGRAEAVDEQPGEDIGYLVQTFRRRYGHA
jgi:hypothetical protein